MKTVFLDRDGVINPLIETDGEKISPQSEQDFELYPDVEEAIRQLKDNGYRVIVATNQPDVNKDWRSLDGEELEKMNDILFEAGVDAVYACTHGPLGGREDKHYRGDGEIVTCDCRKPQPGLLEQAEKDFDIEFPRSFIVGDSRTDMESAERYEEKHGAEFKGKIGIGEIEGADQTFDNLYLATKWIVGQV